MADLTSLIVFAKILFYICMIPLIIYSIKFYSISIASIFNRGRRDPGINSLTEPSVTIQIPVYNDPIVVECVRSCMSFDYPKDRYEIIVVDDSNDGETGPLLDKLHNETNGAFKVIRRGSRRGFKAGALNDATKESKGDIIIVFDSDYVLDADFLRKIVQPFNDSSIAFVQSRWGYLNPGKNRISKLAMVCYNAFHQCSMPVKEKIGTAIFCGTGGAIRKSVLVEAGGWNEASIGEDIDLTVRILSKGYKQVYMPYLKAKGEVPESLKAFVKQQQRWAFATTEVMRKYLGKIMASKMTKRQKFDMVFITTGFLVFPFILGVSISTLITMAPWFGPNTSGEIFNLAEMTRSLSHVARDIFSFEGIFLLLASSGYIFQCGIALLYEKKYRDLTVLPWIFVVGFIVQITNTIAVFKALFGMKYSFYKTPKASYKGI